MRLNRGETRTLKPGKGVRQGCCLLQVLFNIYSNYLTKEALEGFGDFKIGGLVIHIVKYADVLVLLTNEKMIQLGITDSLVGIRTCRGMEMYVEKTKVMRISRQPPEMHITTDKKTVVQCGIFQVFG